MPWTEEISLTAIIDPETAYNDFTSETYDDYRLRYQREDWVEEEELT